MKATTLSAKQIGRLLDRQRRPDSEPDQVPLHELFEEILHIANRFVPSESGSVLIDDPIIKVQRTWSPAENELVFVACFGDKADELLGRRISADRGIVGKTYLTGRPSIATDVHQDTSFFDGVDRDTEYATQSIICVPIQIGRSTCGVLEMINRRGRVNFEESELELLQIFAGYISTSLQNVLDTNRYLELAKRDDLTGLYNDRYFNQRLAHEIEQAEVDGTDLSLIFFDLDHFKKINDKHGHLVGSQTLREVGLILSSAVTADHCTVARYGGDEFVIIVANASLEQAVEQAEEIRRRVETAVFRIDPGADVTATLLVQGVITASIGVASYREFEFAGTKSLRTRQKELIRAADRAMYEAKARGKNRVCYGVYGPGVTGLISSS